MARTESQMLELGTLAPAFSLPDTKGAMHPLRDQAKAHLIMFICNHCPFVIHVKDELAKIGRDYLPRDVAIYAINSNDFVAYPGDSPEMMREDIREYGYDFPYLIDEEQDVAKLYAAACTPDIYLFDADKKLVYRGQLDGSRPGNNMPVDGRDLRTALDALLSGRAISQQQIPSIGCNIKWQKGNEPD